jgi:hypothetical protein
MSLASGAICFFTAGEVQWGFSLIRYVKGYKGLLFTFIDSTENTE